jgi:hypothetical protein
VPEDLVGEGYKVCLELMDDLVNELFEIHVIEPTFIEEQVWKVKPVRHKAIRSSAMAVSPRKLGKSDSTELPDSSHDLGIKKQLSSKRQQLSPAMQIAIHECYPED